MRQVKLKICGVQSAGEASQLAALHVDYIGLNFVPSSSRCITITVAEAIMAVLSTTTTKTVALFRDQPVELVRAHAERLSIDFVQLHGTESADYAQSLKSVIIKAIPIGPEMTGPALLSYMRTYPAAYFVLDRQVQGQGALVNIDVARLAVTTYPNKVFIAGGLTPGNLQAVLQQVQPYGFDIAGGVRTDGLLDAEKLAECVRITAGGAH